MSKIWYLLKCPKENEADYIEKCQKMAAEQDLQEIICFQYQRMLRYGGKWHLERRALLPGHIFLSGTERKKLKMGNLAEDDKEKLPLRPCEISYLKMLCSDGGLINMSRGIIKNGIPVVTDGPLKGHEQLIRRIDRHKRTAELKIPFGEKTIEVTVGLEIYQKEI